MYIKIFENFRNQPSDRSHIFTQEVHTRIILINFRLLTFSSTKYFLYLYALIYWSTEETKIIDPQKKIDGENKLSRLNEKYFEKKKVFYWEIKIII